jgi:hypothetical protein
MEKDRRRAGIHPCFCGKSVGFAHLDRALRERACSGSDLSRPNAYPATNGSAGGKLPVGNCTVRFPARSFSTAPRKATTNHL